MSGEETRLLVVDEDDLVRGMLQAVLEGAGYACLAASSVAEAEQVLDRQAVEITLVDVMLPDGSGIDVVAALHDRFPDTAALVVTGLSDQATARQAIARGAHGMLVKPFTPDELIVAVAAARTRRDLDVEARRREDSLETELRTATDGLESAMTRIDSAGHELLARLAGALEARDLLTAEHIRRVSEGTRLLARALGLPADQAELIGEASTMHDIGKIGLADGILRKPGPLSESEWEAVKEHPVIGRRILENSDLPVMRVAALIAAHHHERWDGTGWQARRSPWPRASSRSSTPSTRSRAPVRTGAPCPWTKRSGSSAKAPARTSTPPSSRRSSPSATRC